MKLVAILWAVIVLALAREAVLEQLVQRDTVDVEEDPPWELSHDSIASLIQQMDDLDEAGLPSEFADGGPTVSEGRKPMASSVVSDYELFLSRLQGSRPPYQGNGRLQKFVAALGARQNAIVRAMKSIVVSLDRANLRVTHTQKVFDCSVDRDVRRRCNKIPFPESTLTSPQSSDPNSLRYLADMVDALGGRWWENAWGGSGGGGYLGNLFGNVAGALGIGSAGGVASGKQALDEDFK